MDFGSSYKAAFGRPTRVHEWEFEMKWRYWEQKGGQVGLTLGLSFRAAPFFSLAATSGIPSAQRKEIPHTQARLLYFKVKKLSFKSNHLKELMTG